MVNLPSLALEKTGVEAPSGGSGLAALKSSFNQLAATLDGIGQTYEQARLDEAAAEGQNAVIRDEAGNLSVSFRDPMRRSDIAYNRAAKTAYLARLSGDVRLRAGELSAESNGDVQAFQQSYKAFSEGLVGRVKTENPEMLGAVQTLLDNQFSSFQGGLIAKQHARDMQSFKGAIAAEINAFDDQMAQLANKGATGSAEYLDMQENVKALYGELVNNPQMALSQQEADLKMRRMFARHEGEAVVGQIERIYSEQGLNAAEKAVETMFDGEGSLLSPAERRQYQGIARTRVRGIRAERRAELIPLQEEARVLREIMTAGGIYDDGEVDEMARGLASLGDIRGSLKLLRTRAQSRQLNEFRQMDDRQQRQALEQVTGSSMRSGEARSFLLGRLQSHQGTSHVENLTPSMQMGLASMMAEAPDFVRDGLQIMSGARSVEHQERLFKNAVKKYGSEAAARKWVAPPGRSNHNHGNAVDLGWKDGAFKNAPKEVVAWVHKNAERYGLKFPLGHEPWHIELSSTRGGTKVASVGSGVDPKVIKTMRAEVKSDAKRMITAIKQGIQNGVAPGNEDLVALQESVALLGDEDLSSEVRSAVEDLQAVEAFSDLPPIAQQNELDEALAVQAVEGRDTDGIDQVDAMEKIYARTRKMLDSDPLGLAIERNIRGIAEFNEPLDFSNVESLGEGLRSRETMAARAGQFFGRSHVSPLRPAEMDALKSTLDQATADEKAQLFGTLAENLSGRNYMQTMAALVKKGSRVTAYAGALNQENPEVAGSVLRGMELLQQEPRLAPKEDDAYDRQTDRRLPLNAFSPSVAGAARADMLNAARARYADLSAQAGDTSGALKPDRLTQAVEDVTGGVVEHNGVKLISPIFGMGQEEFEGVIERLTDDDLRGAAFSSGVPVTSDVVRNHLHLRSFGDGRYQLSLGDAGAERFIVGSNGAPYILNLKARILGRQDR